MINILIIDDHPIVLEGTKNLFNDIDDIIVETENNVHSILQTLKDEKKAYDVYLIDINMPEKNGIDLSKQILTLQPTAFIILYTGHSIEDYFPLILEKKIHGLLSKTATKDIIIRTIRSTVAGELLLPATFIDFVHEFYNASKEENAFKLNEKEKQILQLVSKGYTNGAIAIELQLTQRTIERYLTQIYDIFNVSSRTEAVLVAIKKNLI